MSKQCDIKSGDEAMVRGDMVGRQSNVPVRCLVLALRADELLGRFAQVRARRQPTKTELAEGGFDPWAKRKWWLPARELAPIR